MTEATRDIADDMQAQQEEEARQMTDETLAKQEEEAKDEERLEALYKEAVEVVEGSDFASVEILHKEFGVNQPTAVWIVEKMQQDGLLGSPDENGRCIVLTQPEPSAEGE